MWIVLNKSFLSIVKNRNNDNELLVEQELKVILKKFLMTLMSLRIKRNINIDRTLAENVANVISNELLKIDYDNFKSSVSRNDLIDHMPI